MLRRLSDFGRLPVWVVSKCSTFSQTAIPPRRQPPDWNAPAHAERQRRTANRGPMDPPRSETYEFGQPVATPTGAADGLTRLRRRVPSLGDVLFGGVEFTCRCEGATSSRNAPMTSAYDFGSFGSTTLAIDCTSLHGSPFPHYEHAATQFQNCVHPPSADWTKAPRRLFTEFWLSFR